MGNTWFLRRRAFLDGGCATSVAATVETRLADHRFCSGHFAQVYTVVDTLHVAGVEEIDKNAKQYQDQFDVDLKTWPPTTAGRGRENSV
mmetsp:Transcript_10391/g.29204  ORF Transcript_10391/g.29204 Transcript_10391/m.29204 type:complete len:89 (-) Transcript_10391:214-480(-)